MTAADQLISPGSIRDLARILNEAQPAAKRTARSGAWGEPETSLPPSPASCRTRTAGSPGSASRSPAGRVCERKGRFRCSGAARRAATLQGPAAILGGMSDRHCRRGMFTAVRGQR